MHYSAFPFEVKSLSEAGQLEGLAAGYGNVDFGGDVIAPGAMAASIAACRAIGTMPAMLLYHDPRRLIGRWNDFAESSEGLIARGKLTLETSDAKEAYALLRDRALTGLSVGLADIKSRRGEGGSRVIEKATLHEVSLVSMPQNPKARVSAVKAITHVRDIEDVLVDMGVSGRKAKAAAAAAWRAIGSGTEEETDEEALALILRGASENIERKYL